MGNLARNSVVILLAILLIVLVVGIGANSNDLSGDALTGNAYKLYGFGDAATNVDKFKIGDISVGKLDTENYDNFKKGQTDCFSYYSDYSLIVPDVLIGTQYDNIAAKYSNLYKRFEICIKTSSKDKAGTNANVLFFAGKEYNCLYMDGNGNGPNWNIASVTIKHYKVPSPPIVRYIDSKTVDLNVWLSVTNQKNIVCW